MDDRKVSEDKKRYREAWEYLIDDLALLALRARIDYSEYIQVRDELNRWLTLALEAK